ncbi:MAG: hypothetical protein AABY27_02445 [Pseudomonadota bacterium]
MKKDTKLLIFYSFIILTLITGYYFKGVPMVASLIVGWLIIFFYIKKKHYIDDEDSEDDEI